MINVYHFPPIFPSFHPNSSQQHLPNCGRKKYQSVGSKSYLTIYLIIKCPWQKERLCSGTINIRGNRVISFYVAQTVVEVANTASDKNKSIKSLDATASAAGG